MVDSYGCCTLIDEQSRCTLFRLSAGRKAERFGRSFRDRTGLHPRPIRLQCASLGVFILHFPTGFRTKTNQFDQRIFHFRRQILRTPRLEARRQRNTRVTDADQTGNHGAHRFDHAANLTIPAFAQCHVIPAVHPGAASIAELIELGRAVIELNFGSQLLDLILGQPAKYTHSIGTLDLVTRVHQPVGQFAIIRRQQQAGGIEVEAADGNPTPLANGRERAEDGWAAFRIGSGGDFAFGFVVDNYPSDRFFVRYRDFLPAHFNQITDPGHIAQLGCHTIEFDLARTDPAFDHATGPESLCGQDFLQALFAHAVILYM
jgi:hypothetical protein